MTPQRLGILKISCSHSGSNSSSVQPITVVANPRFTTNYKDLHPSLSLSRPFNLPFTPLCSVPRPEGLRPIFPATITDRPITFRLSLACKRYRIASPPLRPRAPPHLAILMHDLSQPQSAPPLIEHTRPPRRCSTSARTKLIPFWGAPKASIR